MANPTSIDHGSVSATLDNEFKLTTQGPGIYVLKVDSSFMTSGDIVIFKLYDTIYHDGTSGLAYQATYAHKQSEPVKLSVPIAVDTEVICSLEQTDGTARDFAWNLLKM